MLYEMTMSLEVLGIKQYRKRLTIRDNYCNLPSRLGNINKIKNNNEQVQSQNIKDCKDCYRK